jgi:hypothetical protein
MCPPLAVGGEAVEFISLDVLREADERTLSFSPLGLGGKLDPRDAARFQQEVVSHPDLDAVVPKRVRECVERLRTIYVYGVLCYDLFTVAHDQAQLALEFALRERFVEFQGGSAQFLDASRRPHDIATSPFTELQAEVRRHAAKDDEWQLVVRRTGDAIRFDGMLDSLLRWAREEELLRGQRNRARDRYLTGMRDYVAHGAGDHLLLPGDAARAISDVVEIVNQLWGVATPGGRLYPAPIQRDVQLVGWSPRDQVMAGPVGLPYDRQPLGPHAAVEQLRSAVPGGGTIDDWTWVLVRAVAHDDGLMRFDSLFEVTTYPCELLWGPGNAWDAVTWAERELPKGDAVDVLDRLFLVQYDRGRLYLPRRPEIVLGLTDSEQAGTWSLIRTDTPVEAFEHARNVVTGGSGCSRRGQCQQCAVETLRRGTWKEVTDALAAECPQCQPLRVADIRVSSGLRWPRHHQHLDDGNWALGDR